MDELIGKLTAALDETERIALEASDDGRRSWEPINADGAFHMEDPFVGYTDQLGVVAGSMSEEEARHIAHNDPASVLRRVAADRKILKMHPRGENHKHKMDICMRCLDEWPCVHLCVLAEGYGIEVE